MSALWVAAALGATAGCFAFAAWRVTFPPPPSLDGELARLARLAPIVNDNRSSALKEVAGRRLGGIAGDLGIGFDSLRVDARMAGTSLDAHLGSKVVCAVMPIAFIVAAATMFAVAGVAPPTALLATAAMVGVVGGFIAPDIGLRKSAEVRRREFTLALGSYLDLVAISLAGGMGTEGALVESARIGDSWAFDLLGRAVDVAQIDGAPVWTGFARLGDELAVPALVELASSVALAGSEGAKVRSSLAVKADTLRAIELANAESDAHAATERMAIPTALLLFGFLVLIGFPAVITVLGGL